jgi:hypothetical protein
MGKFIATHEAADVAVLREEDAFVGVRFVEERCVSRVYAALARIDDVVADGAQGSHSDGDDIGVGEETHPSGSYRAFFRLGAQSCRVQQASVDVLGLQDRVGLKHRLTGSAVGEEG